MIKPPLSEISHPIKSELEKFNHLFRESMRSDVGLVDLVARYIIRQKGKKIRPLLVLLSAKIAGGITERSYRGAVLVELLHTATLVHDDVVDNADKRRGVWSINALFKMLNILTLSTVSVYSMISWLICSSKRDFKTTAPAPAAAIFTMRSTESVRPLLLTIIGLFMERPAKFVDRSII